MSFTSVQPNAGSSEESLRSQVIDRIDPTKVRVVAFECYEESKVVRHDCYDPERRLEDADPKSVRSILKLVHGEVFVRVIDWARSASMTPSVELEWVATGLHVEDIDRILVSTWPDGATLRIFQAQKQV
jgi:hypothetical protein